jgi:putative redox protein
MSNLLAAIKARKTDIAEVEVIVSAKLVDSPPQIDAINIAVSAKCSDFSLLKKLITVAERNCIVSNTLRGCVEITVNLN